jgi:hypothetical protein
MIKYNNIVKRLRSTLYNISSIKYQKYEKGIIKITRNSYLLGYLDYRTVTKNTSDNIIKLKINNIKELINRSNVITNYGIVSIVISNNMTDKLKLSIKSITNQNKLCHIVIVTNNTDIKNY